jgi:predicted RNA-binding Zn-ribbon protein involved in translation (DUF1610 family)
MTISRPIREKDGSVRTEVIHRCLRCGSDMREEHMHYKCDNCGHIVGCCDGEMADASL